MAALDPRAYTHDEIARLPCPAAGNRDGGRAVLSRYTAQIALWLGAAWLARRAISIALNLYSARKLRVTESPHFLETGRHLLTDLIGLIIFGLAVLGIVGIVLKQRVSGLLATSGLFASIIGLATKRMISDVFSGLALTVERPFAIGDWLESAFLQQGVGFEPSRMNDSRRYFCSSSLSLAGRTCLEGI